MTAPSPLVVDPAAWRESGRDQSGPQEWPLIEDVLTRVVGKSKAVIRSLRRYFLTGKLPDWKKVHARLDPDDHHKRHLDLFCFLWLYPRHDFDELVALRDRYLAAAEPEPPDIYVAAYMADHLGVFFPCANCEVVEADAQVKGGYRLDRIPYACDIALLHRALIHGRDDLTVQLRGSGQPIKVGAIHYGAIAQGAGGWLQHRKLHPEAESCLLRHEYAIEVARRTTLAAPDHQVQRYASSTSIERELLRIRRFEAEREATGARAEFCHHVSRSLDGGGWPEAILEVWRRVGEPGFEIRNLWR